MAKNSTIKKNSPSAPVLITGAGGHLGANLVHRLLDDGVKVRVLVRAESKNEAIQGLNVERFYGDLRQKESLRPALEGCQGVYHVAARIATINGNKQFRRELYECNVVGTRNLLEVARECEAGRVVVTGSFSAVGYDLDNPSLPSDETMQFYPLERTMPYERTKAFVEHECWQAVAKNQDVVVATCCALMGGWDYHPSRLGRTLVDYANGKLRAYVDGGFEFVAARDIVEGHILCMHKGRPGEKYIFSTEFKTISEILDIFEEVTGIPRPAKRVPAKLMEMFAEVASFYLSHFHPSFPQRFTPGAIRLLQLCRHANTQKAQDELGFEPSTIRQAVKDAYEFHYNQRKVITNPDAKPPEEVASVAE
ncbi:MAG: NAD-dependent epimerase/dehydratase family protein [Gammaproteobacteria bacterium]|nr:NAD-dependent epimerase/dehydratase family protein [Gammaproteobacteria bacterium]MCY4219810.1 NAD-dependent epimerase/dehydratase family protein [Gammaproteobacteria bacterium]MCY4274009.1 NAD-dependent epimerase/dehydratase family protein [Gammaproteobacteria bacterium]